MAGYTGGAVPSGDIATQDHFYAANTSNLKGPSGDGTDSVWVPEIFSKNVLLRFRRESVVEGITNNDYFGEIANYGDTVRIIKEPTITIGNYARGDTLSSTSFQDTELVLTLDQAHQFQFEVDDLETKFSHVNWESLSTNAATYNMKMAYDLNVLEYIEEAMQGIGFANKATGADYRDVFLVKDTGTAGEAAANEAAYVTAVKAQGYELTNGTVGAGQANPLNLLSKLALYLDINDVPTEGRYAVVGPEFMDLLSQVDSKLINDDFRGSSMDLMNGLQSKAKVRGFEIYSTNNATSNFVLAGQKSAVATANAIVQTEKFRSQTTFSDVVRGLHVFGRALVREESLVGAYVTYA
jgi:hypothetical protein